MLSSHHIYVYYSLVIRVKLCPDIKQITCVIRVLNYASDESRQNKMSQWPLNKK